MINKEQVKGSANEMVGALKKKWGKLTDDQILQAEGSAQKLYGHVQKAYGITEEEFKKGYNEAEASCGCASKGKAA